MAPGLIAIANDCDGYTSHAVAKGKKKKSRESREDNEE